MSIQFGRWNFDGRPLEQNYLARVSALVSSYGPDGRSAYEKNSLSMLYHAFLTNRESRLETQPYLSASGVVITWDGRLDNRAALARELSGAVTASSSDVVIVAAAYHRWSTGCLSRLIGDWALTIWNPITRALFLAKDFVGTRTLYYFADNRGITWSTILDPLVILAGTPFTLEREYIAGWISAYPATHLTPYAGILAVPPASVVSITDGKLSVRKYWDFEPDKTIHYDTDAAYEEHFRSLFAQSVRRRLRSDTPVLSELSGGMDSSSIVCMADRIIAEGSTDTPRLDTVSYYNDAEPHWNERPYFEDLEARRRRTGCHIRVDSQNRFRPISENARFRPTPSFGRRRTAATSQFLECLNANGNRVLLRGIGGDEVLGGIPNPVPELADLATAICPLRFVQKLVRWALAKRKPVWRLGAETLLAFLVSDTSRLPLAQRPDRWLEPEFSRCYRAALDGYEPRLKVWGPRPSFQASLVTLDALRRQLSASFLSAEPPFEIRYPYLDRDLLEFLYAIPREQLVRPGERRSLMRRALLGIVPDTILNRRTKALVTRLPVAALSDDLPELTSQLKSMVTHELGIVRRQVFLAGLESACHGLEVPMVPLICTLQMEFWLRHAIDSTFLTGPSSICPGSPAPKHSLSTQATEVAT